MEYDLALRIGVDPNRIILNGPLKSEAMLRRALLEGSIVNLDALYEVRSVENIAREADNRSLAVGLRCNFDIGTDYVSRFGFDVDGSDLGEAFARLEGLNNCDVTGLHCHYTVPDRNVASYTVRTQRMLEICASLFGDRAPQFLDLGGGYFGKMDDELKRQFAMPIPSYAEYAAAIAPQIAEAFPGPGGPELILEPGIALTGNVMRFVTSIIDVKTVRSRTMALASGSIHNVKPAPHTKNLTIHVLSPDNSGLESASQTHVETDIVGYTCLENDCLYRGYRGALTAGDYVVFDNVGSYITVLKPPFIRPAPAIVAHNSTYDQFELVRRPEEGTDVFSTYII
jgi:diaminopimelate decarboxylase